MFSDDELNAFYEGKKSGYEEKEYTNPHLEFISGLGGAEAMKEDKLHQQYKRGFEWGKAQKDEEKS
jgi:hypothetical protein